MKTGCFANPDIHENNLKLSFPAYFAPPGLPRIPVFRQKVRKVKWEKWSGEKL